MIDGVSAGKAEFVCACGESMFDGDAFVENETLALPEALVFGNVFEVFEDAAFEVVDLLEALAEEIGCCFFAANTSGAEHGNFGVFGGV